MGMKDLLQEWTVTRSVPPEVWDGIEMGRYALHGGTVAWAPGTERAGQIVRHLMPTYSPIGLAQSAMARPWPVIGATATTAVLQAAALSSALSGLNLLVSAVGFAVLYKKLTDLDKRLAAIGADVRVIKELLQEDRLSFAMRALAVLMDPHREAQGPREDMPRHVLTSVGPINISYRKLLTHAPCESAAERETAMATQQYFTLSSLAIAQCWAELGRIDAARRQLEDDHQFWVRQARRIARSLLGEHPERFVAGEYSSDVSLREVGAWLNFVHDEDKPPWGWTDDLRKKIPFPAEAKSWWPWPGGDGSEIVKQDQETTIPYLRQLVARDSVLRGYVAQYELLDRHGMTPSEFQRAIADLDREQFVDGWLVLEPTQAATPA